MKIWSLHIPLQSQYAHLLSIYVKPKAYTCSTCKLVEPQPLHLEWADGSDVIGDFISAGARIVVKRKIADQLLSQFSGFEPRGICFADHANLYKPAKVPSAKRIWLPYQGPELCELSPLHQVALHPSSTVIYSHTCPECGRGIIQNIQCVEQKNSRTHVSRQPGKGLFVKAHELQGCDLFTLKGTHLILCTDKAKDFMRTQGFSNIDYLEYGNMM